jgi:hypothetical protein
VSCVIMLELCNYVEVVLIICVGRSGAFVECWSCVMLAYRFGDFESFRVDNSGVCVGTQVLSPLLQIPKCGDDQERLFSR